MTTVLFEFMLVFFAIIQAVRGDFSNPGWNTSNEPKKDAFVTLQKCSFPTTHGSCVAHFASSQQKPISAILNGRIEMSCPNNAEAFGTDDATTIKWTYNGENLNNEENAKSEIMPHVEFNADQSMISIKKVEKQNEGKYKCAKWNSRHTASSVYKLKVSPEPIIIKGCDVNAADFLINRTLSDELAKMTGCDLFGNDFLDENKKPIRNNGLTYDECIIKCIKNPNCTHVTSSNESCYLKQTDTREQAWDTRRDESGSNCTILECRFKNEEATVDKIL